MVILESDSYGIPWACESLSRSFVPEAPRVVSGEQQEQVI